MAKTKAAGPANPEIARGIRRFGRYAAGKRGGSWRFSKKGAKGKQQLVKPKPAVVDASTTRWYEADDKAVPIPSRKNRHKPTKLRKSITPGTVVIVLAGRFKGKRVVFLKQLQTSGLLLVSGPFKVNGVPLRRVNQAYVIATSTRLDVSKVDVSKIDDDFFQEQELIENAGEAKFFDKTRGEGQVVVSAARKAAQKAVDTALVAEIAKTPMLKQYLGSRFGLSKKQYPHLLKF